MKIHKVIDQNSISILLSNVESKAYSTKLIELLAIKFAEAVFKSMTHKQIIKYFVRYERIRSQVEKKVADLIITHVKNKLN
jgi:hypothetical protein